MAEPRVAVPSFRIEEVSVHIVYAGYDPAERGTEFYRRLQGQLEESFYFALTRSFIESGYGVAEVSNFRTERRSLMLLFTIAVSLYTTAAGYHDVVESVAQLKKHLAFFFSGYAAPIGPSEVSVDFKGVRMLQPVQGTASQTSTDGASPVTRVVPALGGWQPNQVSTFVAIVALLEFLFILALALAAVNKAFF